MHDLTTELGLTDFLLEKRKHVQSVVGRGSRDAQFVEDAVSHAMKVVFDKHFDGTLERDHTKVLNLMVTCAIRKFGEERKSHAKALLRNDDDLKLAVEGRQTYTPLPKSVEPVTPGAEVLLEQKEDGHTSTKKLSALLLYASNDEEITAILAAITEVIRANESKSDVIKSLNMSEVARQSNAILGYDRFTYKTVQTRLAKFSRKASRYLADTAA